MLVLKRDGRRESVKFDKITARIEKLCYGLDTNYVSSVEVAKKVIAGIYDGVTTVELDNLAAETAATLTVKHPDYAVLAARIAISNLHKVTSKSFSNTMKRLYTYVDPRTGENAPLVSKDTYAVIKKNAALLDSTIIYSRDYTYDYFGFKTLERSYLVKLDGKIVERPQHMLMRVAVGIHGEDVEAAIETYNLLSEKWFTHATPTLFNAGTPKPQMSSCFVAGTKVFTVNDGVKNIEDVVVGDQVITHRGNVKPVVQLHKNPLNERQLYKLKTFGSPSVTVTENHRLWSVSQEQLAWGEAPQWNSVAYLREGDYVAIPDKQEIHLPEALDMTQFVPQQYGNIDVSYETDDDYIYPVSHWTREHQLNESDTLVRVRKKHNAVKKSVMVDRDFAFFVGAWLGDGHIVTGRDAKKEHTFVRGIGITVHCRNQALIAKLEALAEELFGIKPYTTVPNSTNTVSVIVNSHVVGRLFHGWFGKGFANKKLPAQMYRWDRPMVQAFMEGLVTTDGCVTKSGDVRVTMSNIPLVKSVFALCRGVNLAVSYSQARKLKQGGTQLTARIALPKQSILLDNVVKEYDDERLITMRNKETHSSSIREINGQYFLRISKKEKSNATPSHVYTLGVADDHSYVVEGMVVENCFLLSMQDDSIDGIYDTLKQCAQISQSAGGIGLSIHNVRATGSYIRGTNGTSNGIVPMLRAFDMTARYVDQCFHPDTIVYTKQGVKRIDDIVIGEEMLTEDGQYNQVGKLLRSDYRGKMISLNVKQSVEPVQVTPEHPFLVLRNQQKMVNFDVIRNRLEKGYAQPEWVEAKELNENDLIAFPAVSTYEQDMLDYTLDDCRFYGLMVGDGHVAKDGRMAHITMNKAADDVNFVRRYLYESGIRYTLSEHPEELRIRFTWSAHLGFKFNRAMLYDADGQKIVHHSMLHLPKEKTLAVVRGIVEADGCITNRDNYEIMLEMTSRNVIESVRFMLIRFGILTCGYLRDRRGNVSSYKNITSQQKTYCLRLPKVGDIAELFDMPEGQYVSYLRWGNHCFSRVKDIKMFDYEGVVVDFEVLPNHNYVTHAGVAHNGGGKRKGSFAIYLEPWHADIFEFLHLKKNHGKEELRARDLFYALWMPDLFMKRVESNEAWSLFCPNECPGLYDAYGEDFERLYEKYEREGRARRTVRAQDLWFEILESQTETGTPYMLYKDAANKKSNQKNLGTIRSSNLCTEILEYTSKDEVAVCNLASIALPKFIGEDGRFDHQKLYEITKVVTRNLNKVIDVNYYPVPEARTSNMRHRPIGIGIQGLADAFIMLRMPFESEEAQGLNRDIFETIYYAAMETSMELATEHGPYETFEGSPVSEGIFQFDMWGVTPDSGRWDWDALKGKVKKNGVRNSLLLAPMPTASTSQILGNNECFEPYTSNIYTRRVLSGEFIVVNKHLLRDLVDMNLWNDSMKNRMISENGSIQNIEEIPQHLKDLYKTTWEISQKKVIEMAADRGAYICQSQSLNIHMEDPNFGKLTSMHFYAWKKGLKTGMYYLRTKAATDAIKFTVDKQALQGEREKAEAKG